MNSIARKTSFTAFLPVLCLLGLYVLTRSIHVLALPPFLDESELLRYAQDARIGHWLTGANNARLLGGWWVALFQASGDGALWLDRIASILAGMISVSVV